MRVCSLCAKEDRPYFEPTPCSCGAPVHDSDPSPSHHAANCNSVGHEVVLYPVRIPERELVWSGGDPGLQPKWKGWKLVRNGNKYYRCRFLCRACQLIEEEKAQRRKERESLCKAARGEDEKTYAQMLAQQ